MNKILNQDTGAYLTDKDIVKLALKIIEHRFSLKRPASKEAGKLLDCAQCGACNGGKSRKGSIAIIVHGSPILKPEVRFSKLERKMI